MDGVRVGSGNRLPWTVFGGLRRGGEGERENGGTVNRFTRKNKIKIK